MLSWSPQGGGVAGHVLSSLPAPHTAARPLETFTEGAASQSTILQPAQVHHHASTSNVLDIALMTQLWECGVSVAGGVGGA